MSETEKKAAPVAASAELRTPEEWAGPCGQRRPKSF
jgi:hypothetical protein